MTPMMASARRPSSGRIREEGEAAFFAWTPVFVCFDCQGAKPLMSFLPNRSAASFCSFVNSVRLGSVVMYIHPP